MNAGRVLNHENLPHRVCVPTNLSRLRMIYTRLKRLRIKRGDDASDPQVHLRRAPRRIPHGEG